jgi:hypothetical protein
VNGAKGVEARGQINAKFFTSQDMELIGGRHHCGAAIQT